MMSSWRISYISINVELETLERIVIHLMNATENVDETVIKICWFSALSTTCSGKNWTTGHAASPIRCLIMMTKALESSLGRQSACKYK